jgi:antitoxin VapB
MARTKIFRSGNANAVRFPASFDVKPGTIVEVREEQGRWIVEAVAEPPKKIDISGFAGKAPGIRLAPPEDFDERPSAIAARNGAREA